jgi:hypothetical protein
MQCYLGQSDPTHDVQKRLQIMYKAVDMPHELSDKNDTTLKIFLVPEFFGEGRMEHIYLILSTSDVVVFVRFYTVFST